MLGEFLEQNCPEVSVQVVVKSNEDWGEYIDAVSIRSKKYAARNPKSNDSCSNRRLLIFFVIRCVALMVSMRGLALSFILWKVSSSETAQISLSM